MPMSKICNLLILLSITLTAAAYGSNEPITFGPEIELSNKDLKRDVVGDSGSFLRLREAKWANSLVKEIKKTCGSFCRYEKVLGKYGLETRVYFKNGFYFQISWDPTVVEIIMKPSSLKEFRANADDIEKYLYAPAARLELKGADNLGGHVNIGLNSAFGEDAELFLRYFIDYANHPELALGVFAYDIYNGPPLSVLKSEQRSALNDTVAKFYVKKFKNPTEVILDIQRNVYTHSYKWDRPQHYQSVGLESIPSETLNRRRIEHRSVRGQKSFQDFLLMAELIELRHTYLKKNKNKIIYLKSDEDFFLYQRQMNLFWVYTQELGVNYEKYVSLLSEPVRALKPDIIFERKIDWSSWSDQDEILWWSTQLFKYPWVRSQLIKTLSTPEAQSTDIPAKVLEKVKTLVSNRGLNDKKISQIITDFEVSLSQKHQHKLNACESGLRGAHLPQQ